MLCAQQEDVDMPAICLYFQVHQPYRLRRYTVFDLGQSSIYEDDDRNCDTLLHVARTCYLPMNDVLLRTIQKHGQRFRVAFSISGTALDQFEQYAPEVLESFQALAKTGCVEFLAETYSHSLAFLYSREEFQRQVALHSARIQELFGQTPRVFRHTELIYNNTLAEAVEEMGFSAVLAEGADHVLGWRSPNYVYQPMNCQKLKLLLKNYTLSDDVSQRFAHQGWDQWPLTAEKFASWVHGVDGKGETVNLFMDYETFGLHNRAETGIFAFIEALPAALLAHGNFYFRTPGEVATACSPMGRVDVPQFMSWATSGHDLDTWLGNDMQKDAVHALYALSEQSRELSDPDLLRTWTRLQTAEHFAYMCTKWFSENAQTNRLRSPYGSPYDAYINYMNVLADYRLALEALDVQTPALSASLDGQTTQAAARAPVRKPRTAKATTGETKPATKSKAAAAPKPSAPKAAAKKTAADETKTSKVGKSEGSESKPGESKAKTPRRKATPKENS